jgi:hypothetical protein
MLIARSIGGMTLDCGSRGIGNGISVIGYGFPAIGEEGRTGVILLADQ